jgi:hypothetical protein
MPTPPTPSRSRLARSALLLVALACVTLAGCRRPTAHFDPKNQTYAELRAVRRGVKVTPPGEHLRAPYARERLADGAEVDLDPGALAWLRRDGGATLLVAGPAKLTLRTDSLVVDSGKLFVDTLAGGSADLVTPKGALHLSGVRASLEVGASARAKDGVDAYVLAGEVKTASGLTARAGEELVLADGAPSKHAVLSWDDWTGGLATTDESAEPAPFGVGTVAARSPGARGQARFPLAIQKLEVRVTIDHDLAITEVDELFFNPSAEKVEGIYQFRTPAGATLHRFGVDRDGTLAWGRVKEKAAAAEQYQSNVYEGSTEDPALLEWNAPGVYQARLYPIAPGGTRRVVTRYAEWLARQGDRGERRLYVYPMAADGAEASLPRIEELRVAIDLSASGATDVRTGMHGVTEGKKLIVQQYDVTPRADLAVELFDGGQPTTTATAYRAKHTVQPELLAVEDRAAAEKQAKSEADYVLLPVRPIAVPDATGGLDVAVVVDTSAATDPASLAIARAATAALLAHLTPQDRVAVWASDAALRPVADGSDQLAPLDDARREAILAGLAKVERGGATDLGAVLAVAASKLDPGRRGFLVYVGDGKPSVGELAVKDLRERLAQQTHPSRLFALGIGAAADMGVLDGIARGGFAERVVNAHAAASSALRILEEAERPVWLGVKVDLGLGVDRVYPREMTSLYADQTALVVGRVTRTEPTRVEVSGPGGTDARVLTTVWVPDDGDLRRRWAEGRLSELLEEGAGRAAVVEVGVRYGVVTPYTSYYVPTARELQQERDRATPEQHVEIARLDNAEGGTGTRAKGEEGSMGNPSTTSTGHRYGVRGPADNTPSAATRAPSQVLKEAAEFGMIGLLNDRGAPAPAASAAAMPTGNVLGGSIGDSFGAGGLGLSGVGEGGGGRGEGIGLGGLGTIGHGSGGAVSLASPASVPTASGSGFGNGHGRLGGAHQVRAPSLREGKIEINPASSEAKAKKAETKPAPPKPLVSVVVAGAIGFVVRPCDPSSEQPLEDRMLLWRERLLDVGHDAERVAGVYADALGRCEAPTWPERARLLHLMLDALGSVRLQVSLWRVMFDRPTAADILYRSILARVHTTAEMRELHDALGLQRIDPEILRGLLAREKTPHDKATKLAELGRAWPDDLELALRLLDAYEDAGDTAGERTLARKLRRRDDANAKVRTAVGEAYLRLAKLSGGTKSDEAEARRAFGEIVEFAVDDPVARRRLGDLLRSHGWYEEAFRQYETLAKLTPDDGSVSLLLAAAAAGMGKVEEAVGWTEKAGASGAPDGAAQGPLARDLASVVLAWAEDDAVHAGRKDEATALRQRAAKLSSEDHGVGTTARMFLTWSHPEVHATLWWGTGVLLQPAPEGDPLLGLAAATFPESRHDLVAEIRLEPDDAAAASRLDAEAQLTVVYGEGTDAERVLRVPIHLRPARTARRFHLDPAGVSEEVPK